MTTSTLADVLFMLAARRRALRMSTQTLAKRSKVSVATVRRILKGNHGSASLGNVVSVAEALGLKTVLQSEVGDEQYLTQQAEKKARQLVSMVQGTMGLEGQGLKPAEAESLVQETTKKLLSGSKGKLWR